MAKHIFANYKNAIILDGKKISLESKLGGINLLDPHHKKYANSPVVETIQYNIFVSGPQAGLKDLQRRDLEKELLPFDSHNVRKLIAHLREKKIDLDLKKLFLKINKTTIQAIGKTHFLRPLEGGVVASVDLEVSAYEEFLHDLVEAKLLTKTKAFLWYAAGKMAGKGTNKKIKLTLRGDDVLVNGKIKVFSLSKNKQAKL